MHRLRAMHLRRFPAFPTVPVVKIVALTGLLLGLSWVIVKIPGLIPVVVVLGIVAVVVWTLYPNSAVYTLVALCPFGMEYEVFGLTGIVPTDGVILVTLAVATILLLEGRGRADRFETALGKFLLGFWMLILVWSSVTFYVGPANADMMSGSFKDIWYLYRGVWRNFLVFPVAVLCLRDRAASKRAITLLVSVSSLVSAYAIALSWQTHAPATGPFSSKNGLAGFLVLVLPFAIAQVLLGKEVKSRLLYALGASLMIRALWLTASRGGMVAFIVSLLPFLLLVPVKRLIAAGAVGVVILLIFIGTKGNLLNRPNLQRYLTLGSYSHQQNFEWREEQWRIFIERIEERPWLGSGSEVAEGLRQEGRLTTAHNSYLGMTLRAGIPGAAGWVLILVFVLGLSLKCAFKFRKGEERIFWIGTAGLVLAWLTHSYVDNVLLMDETQRLFWLVLAALLLASNGRVAPAAGHAVVRGNRT